MLRPARVLLAGAIAAAGALVGIAAPAQAAPRGTACDGTEGVTVLVDFGGTEQVGCAQGDPASGTDALTKAGFAWTFHPRETGFICTIGGSPADQQCMKPNYWSYWHKSGGGGWQYSNVGATQYDPAPGSTEGWSFGSQGIAPNGSTSNGIVESQPTVKPTPTPTPTRTPKPSPTTAPGSGGGSGSGTAGGSTSGSGGQEKGGQATGGRTERVTVTRPDGSTVTVRVTKKRAEQLRRQQEQAATPSAAPSASASEQAQSEAELAPAAARTEPGAGTVPWWWGAAALAGLAVVGGGTALLRRRGA